MTNRDFPLPSNLEPEDPNAPTNPLGDVSIPETSAGAGTGFEGFGITSALGEEEGGTGEGNVDADARTGSEETAIASGYGGAAGPPSGPTGTPTAARDAAATTPDGSPRPRRPASTSSADDSLEDIIDEASLESFPASDAPTYPPHHL